MEKEKEQLFNLDKSWTEAYDYLAGAHKFQYLAIKKIRETELRFQRGTEPDKLVLQSLELAKEIILNLKLE